MDEEVEVSKMLGSDRLRSFLAAFEGLRLGFGIADAAAAVDDVDEVDEVDCSAVAVVAGVGGIVDVVAVLLTRSALSLSLLDVFGVVVCDGL